jgi:hypothetical protein
LILLPYTRLHPATARLANRHAPGHVRVRLDPGDMSAYWRLLAKAWREPGDLVVIEHDIGVHAGVLPGFAACPEPYCGHAYPLDRGVLLACLGCTRFAASLKAAEPDLLDVVGEVTGDGLPARDWRRLDVRTGDELRRRGYSMHVHAPPLRHYHKYGGTP